MTSWAKRFLVHGVFWRQFLRWGVVNCPSYVEPVAIAAWALLFMLWRSGRRGVMANLTAIKPGSWKVTNFFRAYRVFFNFAWTIADNGRCKEFRTTPDWEFAGLEHLEELQSRPGGAIILTAHMGSYDLGAQVFSRVSDRRLVMVRAPETDPETQDFESRQHDLMTGDALRIDFNVRSTDLAIELLHAIEAGELVAIQGDRVTPGVGATTVKLFGKATRIPTGPFALAMASRAPIYPLFIIRRGRRRYVLQTCQPIYVQRGSRNREEDLRPAVEAWARQLETIIGERWHQWFTFEPFSEELAA
ncbi:MAG TPA: lysophospholipid acyltransferase family protein [Thermoanaerobaculia bacterium]|nr:lysophospholipid acyltransferase family protein [Thermoanaerobaculia bacterium]